jgi:hypothetical protein
MYIHIIFYRALEAETMREREKNKGLLLLQDLQMKSNLNHFPSTSTLKTKSYNTSQNAELKVYSSKCEQNDIQNFTPHREREAPRQIGHFLSAEDRVLRPRGKEQNTEKPCFILFAG